MDVIFIPDHTDGNPYQRQLAEGISAAGVDVTVASGYPLSTLRTVLRIRPDAIHLHWIAPYLVTSSLVISILQSFLFLCVTGLAKLSGIHIVWTVHNLLDHERAHPRFELGVRILYARLSDTIIVHCPTAQDAVMQRYRLDSEEKITVIPHGHYETCYENTISRAQARKGLGIDLDRFVFLYFGQIRPYKQIPRLVDTFAALPDDHAALLIAGKSVDETEAEIIRAKSKADARVMTNLSFIPTEDVQIYMNAADVVVLPYRDILTSGSAILGMTFGNPIIGPKTGCLPGLLDMQNELLYNSGDGSLLDAMRHAVDADLDGIGEYNRQRALALDWELISRKTRQVYEQL